MKKIILVFSLLCVMTPVLYASYDDGRTERGGLARIGMVEGRGLLNVIGLPLELPYTAVNEVRVHKLGGPVTFLPQFLLNVVARSVSAFNDMICFPWVAPFTDDLSPLTEGMGLTEYPWQSKEGSF